MLKRARHFLAILALVVAALERPALAQLPPVTPTGPATLWSFLGIPQAYRGFRDSLNARGNRPGLERKPPMKAIADPSNLKSDVPAIKKAAEIKAQEDLKPQKIKAIKYLAGIGCGCYNRDGSITDALLKGMDDCTEDVRLATVRSIAEAAAGEACANCKQRSCCSEDISNKLYEIAYERDDTGCYLEPSERVRLSAAEALRTCCPGSDEDFVIQSSPTTGSGGGEQPGVVPNGGGERPGGAPAPQPAAPRVNPDLPPVPMPSAEASAPKPSSRRTAVMKAAVSPALTNELSNAVATITSTPPAAVSNRPGQPVQPAIYVLPASNSAAAAASSKSSPSQAVKEESLPPIVKPENTRRPPPGMNPTGQTTHARSRTTTSSAADTLRRDVPAETDQVPAPPMPSVSQAALLISAKQPQLPAAEKALLRNATSSSAAPASSVEQPKRPKPARPAARRAIPGAKFGTGTVASIHLKEGVAMLEFSSEAAVPPGSIVRTYHDFALTANTVVCDLEVVRSEAGLTAAVARPGQQLKDLAIGDRAIVLR